MRRLFNTNFNNEAVHFMLLVLRVSVGALILIHGYQNLQWILAGVKLEDYFTVKSLYFNFQVSPPLSDEKRSKPQ